MNIFKFFKQRLKKNTDNFNITPHTTLSDVFNCVDRGEVLSYIKNGKEVIDSCTSCHSPVHLIILKDTKERRHACPKCLLLVREDK